MITIDGLTFELLDFEKSATAKKKGIDNTLKGDDILDYLHLMGIIEKIQRRYGKPIYINSGFRSLELNKAVGGAKRSQHLSLGNESASDLSTKSKSENKVLYSLIKEMIEQNEILLDQIIDEKNSSWIHISAKRIGYNRKQFLKI